DFIPRAIAPIYDSPIELRRASRLLIVGNVRVPRVAIRLEAAGPPTRLTLDVVPPLPVMTASDAGRVLVRVDADALDIATTPAGAGLIDQIRTGEQTTTIAIALNARAGMPRISTMTTNESTRVLVEVPIAAPQETAAPTATPAPPPAPAPAPPEGPPALLGARTARLQTMVLDAGHGGGGNGVGGAERPPEKKSTLPAAGG